MWFYVVLAKLAQAEDGVPGVVEPGDDSEQAFASEVLNQELHTQENKEKNVSQPIPFLSPTFKR